MLMGVVYDSGLVNYMEGTQKMEIKALSDVPGRFG